MIRLRSSAEIDAIARAGAIIARLFDAVEERIRPGESTAALDAFAEDLIRSHPGAEPAFKGLYGFPATLCTSINEEVVHGIPSPGRVLLNGDILTIDVGVQLDGWFADSARTFPVGEVSDDGARLLDVTRRALEHGIEAARPGNRIGDVGHAIQCVAEEAGVGVVRELVGHGIGRKPHEEPQVPNVGRPGRGARLSPGLVIAIEPMFAAGEPRIITLDDEWTVITADGALSAHFEHTVAVTAEGPRILTI